MLYKYFPKKKEPQTVVTFVSKGQSDALIILAWYLPKKIDNYMLSALSPLQPVPRKFENEALKPKLLSEQECIYSAAHFGASYCSVFHHTKQRVTSTQIVL